MSKKLDLPSGNKSSLHSYRDGVTTNVYCDLVECDHNFDEFCFSPKVELKVNTDKKSLTCLTYLKK